MNPKHVEGRGTHTAVQTGTIQSDDTLCFFFSQLALLAIVKHK